MTSGPHEREQERLAALRSYGILDTPRETDFDDVVRILTEICNVPMATITLVDHERQWFKAAHGLGEVRETPRDISACTHAILEDDLLIVPDMSKDPRFANNPLVTGDPKLRFYAGAAMKTDDGLPIGTVCVIDVKPHQLNDGQQHVLKLMAKQVMAQIALRREVGERKLIEQKQHLLIAELHHRVKNTLATVQAVIQLSLRSATDMEGFRAGITNRIASLANTHTLLSERQWDAISFKELVATELAPYERTGRVTIDGPDFSLAAQTAVTLGMVIHELTTNAGKYGALSRDPGKLSLAWTLTPASDGDTLALTWKESGGPKVIPPAKDGFGSTLLRRIIEREFRGSVDVSFAPKGLQVALTARLPKAPIA